MKVISLTVLLYGKDFLGYALQSVIDAVDECWVLYTPTGSQGHRETTPCPETRDELYRIAQSAAGEKLHWHEGTYAFEGQHRDAINHLAPDADGILVVDADEIWSVGAVRSAQFAIAFGQYGRYRVPMYHYWRSFYRGILHDPAYPVRVICPKRGNTETQLECHYPDGCRLHHYGYAQNSEIVRWKWENTHGHKNELRHDVDWFHDKYLANAQTDCHPVGSEYWNPETVDPFALGLPEWMREHPYSQLQVIE